MQIVSKDGRVFSRRSELIEVTARDEPDPTWRYTDPSGHEHCWVRQSDNSWAVPTAVTVIELETEDSTVSHLECWLCRAIILPKRRGCDRREYQQGLTGFYIDDEEVMKDEFMREWAKSQGE